MSRIRRGWNLITETVTSAHDQLKKVLPASWLPSHSHADPSDDDPVSTAMNDTFNGLDELSLGTGQKASAIPCPPASDSPLSCLLVTGLTADVTVDALRFWMMTGSDGEMIVRAVVMKEDWTTCLVLVAGKIDQCLFQSWADQHHLEGRCVSVHHVQTTLSLHISNIPAHLNDSPSLVSHIRDWSTLISRPICAPTITEREKQGESNEERIDLSEEQNLVVYTKLSETTGKVKLQNTADITRALSEPLWREEEESMRKLSVWPIHAGLGEMSRCSFTVFSSISADHTQTGVEADADSVSNQSVQTRTSKAENINRRVLLFRNIPADVSQDCLRYYISAMCVPRIQGRSNLLEGRYDEVKDSPDVTDENSLQTGGDSSECNTMERGTPEGLVPSEVSVSFEHGHGDQLVDKATEIGSQQQNEKQGIQKTSRSHPSTETLSPILAVDGDEDLADSSQNGQQRKAGGGHQEDGDLNVCETTGAGENSKEECCKLESIHYSADRTEGLVSFSTDPDCRRLCSRLNHIPISEGVHLEMEQVPYTCHVLVTNIPDGIDQDHLSLHISTEATVGKPEITETKGGKAVLKLATPEDVWTLCQMGSLPFKGRQLTFHSYYDHYGISLSCNNKSGSSRFKKQLLSDIVSEPMLLKLLETKESHRMNFMTYMEKRHIHVRVQKKSSCSSGKTQGLVLRKAIGCDHPDYAALALSWKNLSNVVDAFFEESCVEIAQIKVEPDVWQQLQHVVNPLVFDSETSYIIEVHTECDLIETVMVAIAGKSTEVKCVQDCLLKNVKRIKDRLSREKNTHTEKVNFPSMYVNFLKLSGFFTELESKITVRRSPTSGTSELVFIGLSQEISDAVRAVKDACEGLTCESQEVKPLIGKLLQKSYFSALTTRNLEQQGITAVVKYVDRNITAVAKTVEEALMALQCSLSSVVYEVYVPEKDEERSVLKTKTCVALLAKLNSSTEGEVTVCLRDGARFVELAGTELWVIHSKQQVEKVVLCHAEYEQEIQTEAGKFEFVWKYHNDEIEQFVCVDQQVTFVQKPQEVSRDGKNALALVLVVLRGPASSLQECVNFLVQLFESVECETWTTDLAVTGCAAVVHEEEENVLAQVEKKTKTSIRTVPRMDDGKLSKELSQIGGSEPRSTAVAWECDMPRENLRKDVRRLSDHNASDSNFLKFCGISVEIVKGELAKTVCDVMVNSADKSMDLRKGKVSSSLLEASKAAGYGDSVQREVRDEMKSLMHVGMYTSGSHGLPCQFICHSSVSSGKAWSTSASKIIQDYVTFCLEFCESNGLTKIAFPALGTGGVGYPAEHVAKTMYQTVSEFAENRTGSCSVSEVMFVVYPADSKVIQAFEQIHSTQISGMQLMRVTSRNEAGPTAVSSAMFQPCQFTIQDSLSEMIQSPDEEEGIHVPSMNDIEDEDNEATPPVFTYRLYGKTEAAIEAAKRGINKQFHRVLQSMTTVIPWPQADNVCELQSHQSKLLIHLRTAARRKGIQMSSQKQPNTLTLVGPQTDRQVVCELVEEGKLALERWHKAASDSYSFTWYYKDKRKGWEKLNPLTSSWMETGYRQSRQGKMADDARGDSASYLTSEGRTVVVNFKRMCICMEGDSSEERSIKRNPATVPPSWTQSDRYEKCEVLPSSDEFVEVKHQFLRTIGSKSDILESSIMVTRIENPRLWRQYCSQLDFVEETMNDDSLPVERILYHGTSEDVVMKICETHFDSRHSGEANAKQYGGGCYFAQEAEYSARTQYSKANSAGEQFVIQARVLTGNLTKGHKKMSYLPKGYSGKTYHCAVNDTDNPTVFVTFNDNQAYPEYIIKFKRRQQILHGY